LQLAVTFQRAWRLFVWLETQNTIGSPHFELARVLERLDHVARFIVNADHGIV
jgi:hypothetical protein